MRSLIARICAAIAVAAIIALGVVQPQVAFSQSTALWPQVTVASVLTATSGQIIGTNPTRRYLSICNPSAAIVAWIAPGTQAAAANGGGSISIAPVASNVTSCFTTPIISDRYVGQSWNAIAVTTATSLTILEY